MELVSERDRPEKPRGGDWDRLAAESLGSKSVSFCFNVKHILGRGKHKRTNETKGAKKKKRFKG